MNGRAKVSWAVIFLLAVPGLRGLAQAPAVKPPVATVGSRRVERDEYERRLAIAEQQVGSLGASRPAEFRDVLRRQMLETLIRLDLLVLEAKRLGITTSAAEAESALKRDPFFSPGGVFDAQRWQLTKASQAGRFQSALGTMSEQLAARRLDERLQNKFRPADDVLRAKSLRQLRHAVTEDLTLRVNEFSGNYPEPRESDVLAAYHANPAQFRLPARALLSVVFVNDPPMTQLERSDASAAAAWTARMRRAADSVLTAVRGGVRLEDASAPLGGPRTDVTVLPDNFPGYWKGSPATSAAVFRTAAGSLLNEPVPGTDGFLVVRVDRVEPEHSATLSAVAKELRGKLRDDSRLNHDERDRRVLFAALRDSLSGPAWSFRWVAIDTASVRVPEPTGPDLDRWYRGHLADFSAFDAGSGTIVAKTLAQVRDEVRSRLLREQRVTTARLQADELYRAWDSRRRPMPLEAAVHVRESQMSPRGAALDTGFAAVVLSDTVWARGEPSGAGIAPYARGFLVWQVTGHEAHHVPTFDQAAPALRTALDERQRAIEEAGARQLWAADPKRFTGGRIVYFTRMVVPQPPIDQIKLTRAEVERWQRRNIEKYSAPELVRAKHILISPTNASAAADRAARARADSLFARIKAGESFDALAALFSDDPATKDKGGDLGVFARGTMLEPFENAAFAMQSGDLGGPVKSEVGYHIIRCTEHVPPYVQPLKLVYSIVASDCARARADTASMVRADSLIRHIKSAAQGHAVADRLGLELREFSQGVDERMINVQLQPYFDEVFRLKAGEVMPHKWRSKGEGCWITWVDSIGASATAGWEQAKLQAIAAFRGGAGGRALAAKIVELDSLSAAGWSLDSLGAMWGGLNRSREIVAAGTSDKGDIPAALDSLVFGTGTAGPALKEGEESAWVRWPGGFARIRLRTRHEPPADRVRVRMDELRKIAVERQLSAYHKELARRFPVHILDKALEAIPLPEPPPED